MDAALIKPFTAKTGIEVVKTVNVYAKLKAMVEANAVDWDVAQLDSTLRPLRESGLLEKLDYGVINKSDLIKGAAHESYSRWTSWRRA
jgi:putative spermidine/putrescine transport system substrate-binding protein